MIKITMIKNLKVNIKEVIMITEGKMIKDIKIKLKDKTILRKIKSIRQDNTNKNPKKILNKKIEKKVMKAMIDNKEKKT